MAYTLDQLVIFAVRAGDIDVLKERVNAGGRINYIDPIHGNALIEAIQKEKLEIIDYLIENGADVNIKYKDCVGPIEIALRYSMNPLVVQRLSNAGAKLRKKARPFYKERLKQCIIEMNKNKQELVDSCNQLSAPLQADT